MTGIDFLQAMNDIDDDLLESASKEPSRIHYSWSGWALAVAGVIILFGLGFLTSRISDKNIVASDTVVEFRLDEKTYEPFRKAEYITYGLCAEEDEEQRTAVYVPAVTEDDLGERMGEVTVSVDGRKIDCSVYHYREYPDNVNVCILEYPKGEYRLFISEDN